MRPAWHQKQYCWWCQCCPLILQLCGVLPFVNTSSLWCKTNCVWLRQFTGLSTHQAPGGAEHSKCSRARLEAEGRALKCVQSISPSVRTRPPHANSTADLLNDAVPVPASDDTSKSQHHHKTPWRVSLGVVQLQVLKSILSLVLAWQLFYVWPYLVLESSNFLMIRWEHLGVQETNIKILVCFPHPLITRLSFLISLGLCFFIHMRFPLGFLPSLRTP